MNGKLQTLCILSLMLRVAAAPAASFEVGQSNKAFVLNATKIMSLKIKKGDSIAFRNMDPFYHNIFSLSDAKTFDLGSFPKGEFRTLLFENSGTVEVECAIHPEMHMTIDVE